MPGILDNLTNNNSIFSNLNGGPGPVNDFENSKLHNQYSINGTPNVVNKPSPSILDLDGLVPATNYRDNAPENRTF
jgi:hypothetical protein